MEITEFINETNKLEKFYDKELDQYQKNIWFNNFKTISIKRYQDIIKQAYTTCKFMPKLADLVEINKTLPYKQNNEEITEKVECKICNGLGYILYKKQVEGYEYEYFARCDCKNGIRHAYDGTKVTDPKGKTKNYVATIRELNLIGG